MTYVALLHQNVTAQQFHPSTTPTSPPFPKPLLDALNIEYISVNWSPQ